MTKQWQKQSNLEASELSGNVVVKDTPILKSQKKKRKVAHIFYIGYMLIYILDSMKHTV